jgi:hypothetical protein
MKNFTYTILFLLVALVANAQRFKGGRLGAQVGLANPVGSFSNADDPFYKSNGYASTGLDVTVFGDLFLTDHLSLGIRGGYSLFEVQDSELEERVNASGSELITIRTTPYQNLNLSGVFGYTGSLIKDKLDINPYLGVGLGVIGTSDREIAIRDTTGAILFDFNKQSEINPSLQVTPGVAFHIALLSFLDLRFYGEYVFADHKLEETTTTRRPADNNTITVMNQTVKYELRSINIGGGLSLRF